MIFKGKKTQYLLRFYWSILKSFLICQKIPCIPPLFENNEYITDLKKKTELFNSFFWKPVRLN